MHSSLGVKVLEGTAGRIPLETASVDGLVIAQAFHWFANKEAITEIHRVLKPGKYINILPTAVSYDCLSKPFPGKGLSLLWNMEDESVRDPVVLK